MTTVSPSQSQPNDTIEASDINNPINQIAATVNGGIDSTNIAAGGVAYDRLVTTLLSGRLTTYTNANTAGGTFYYGNLLGIKVFWGATASKAVGTGGAAWIIDLPTSFFTTLQSVITGIGTVTTDNKQWVSLGAQSTTGITIVQYSNSNGSTQVTNMLVIGT